jgi:hypothetical protein
MVISPYTPPLQSVKPSETLYYQELEGFFKVSNGRVI